MRVEVVRAWPRRHESVRVEVRDGASVAEAVLASGLDTTGTVGYAVFGERAEMDRPLREDDRVELLRPLVLDPMEARRRRAGGARRG